MKWGWKEQYEQQMKDKEKEKMPFAGGKSPSLAATFGFSLA
jgi:hypothetical protein